MLRSLLRAITIVVALSVSAGYAIAGGTVTVTSVLDDMSGGTLREAIDSASGPTVIDFSLPADSTIDLISQLTIDQDITITGPGVDDLAITTSADISVFVCTSPLDISGVTVEAVSTTSPGAAISSNGADVTVSSCTFDTCASFEGGAIHATGSMALSVSDSLFTGCSAAASGGAVFTDASVGATFSGCTFNFCTADGGGGALSLDGPFMISECQFSACNTPFGAGGGLQVDADSGTTHTITTCLFQTCDSPNSSGGGIAIAIASGTIDIVNTTFSNCDAANDGGGLALDATSSGGSVRIINSTITTNTATNGDGGGIHIPVAATATVALQNTIVASNLDAADDADVHGAFISTGGNLIGQGDSAVFTPDATDLVGTADDPIDPMLDSLSDNGGAVSTHAPLAGSPAINLGVDNGDTPAEDVTGVSRPAAGASDAGAVELPGLEVTNLLGGTDDANSLPWAIDQLSTPSGEHYVIGAEGVTGTIMPEGAMNPGMGNTYTILGPGPGMLTIDGSLTGATDGLLAFNSSDEVAISGFTFANNTSVAGAGIAYSDGPGMTVRNCAFSGLTADDTTAVGGALFAGTGGVLTIQDCTFTGCHVINSAAGVGGGALLVGEFAFALLERVTIDGCSSVGNDGGGAYFDEVTNVSIRDTRVTGCNGDNGGGVAFDGGGSLTISGSTLDGNTATGAGGGLFHSGTDTLTITNSTIAGNDAGDGGGGASLSGTIVAFFQHLTVANNTAGDDGGGLAIATTFCDVRNCVVARNTATGDGDDLITVGALSTGGGNVIGNNSDSGATFDGTNDMTGTDGALLDAGLATELVVDAQTPTLPLLADSVAIDNADDSQESDQRGVPRPQLGGYDSGAYELSGELTLAAGTQPGDFINDSGAADVLAIDITNSDLSAVTLTGLTIELALGDATIADVESVAVSEVGGSELASVSAPATTTIQLALDEALATEASISLMVTVEFAADVAGTVTTTLAGVGSDVLAFVTGLPLAGDTLAFTGEATALAITTQPTSQSDLTVVVEVQDANGNAVVLDTTTEITAALGTGSGSLGGTTTVTVTAGVATFDALTLAATASGDFSISFSATGLTGAESDSFTVTVSDDGGGDNDNGGVPAWPLAVLLALLGAVVLRRR